MGDCWLLAYCSQARKHHHAAQRCICGQPLWDRVVQYMGEQAGHSSCGRILFVHDDNTHSDQCCQLHCLPGALERAQRSCHLAKHLAKSGVWHSVSASLNYALIMAMLSSFHLTLSSVLGKRSKLHGAKSGRYRGFGTTAPLFLARSSRMDKV